MGIEKVFDGGGAPYVVNETVNESVRAVAGRMIGSFFDGPEETGRIRVFYRGGLGGLAQVEDRINRDNAGTLRGSRDEKFLFFKGFGRFASASPDYLDGVQAVYLQFCSSNADLKAIGIERTDRGTEIGAYEFSSQDT